MDEQPTVPPAITRPPPKPMTIGQRVCQIIGLIGGIVLGVSFGMLFGYLGSLFILFVGLPMFACGYRVNFQEQSLYRKGAETTQNPAQNPLRNV